MQTVKLNAIQILFYVTTLSYPVAFTPTQAFLLYLLLHKCPRHREFILTLDIQLDEIWNAISFDIGSCAWIVPSVPTGDSLKDETLVAHDDPRSDVVLQGTSLQERVLGKASALKVGCQNAVKSNPFQLLWCYQNFAPLFLHKSRTTDVMRKVRQ